MAKSSFYTSGGGMSSAPAREYEPVIDKNPIYRTNDIFSRAHKKKIVVKEGDLNQTDCTSTVWVKFSDPVDQKIVESLGIEGGRNRYMLSCGHEWSGKLAKQIGEELACMKCGADQGYLGFEHEWQHIIFKTNPIAAKLFVSTWAKDLKTKAPFVDEVELEKFLFYVLNAFDDIRCNSLWELIYPGSADRIWKRWTRISNSRGPEANSENFIGFLFAVALGTPTTTGPYENLRPCIEWGMKHVRYKGYTNAMTVAKLALEQCIETLLSQMAPPPQPQQQQGAQNGQAAQQQDPQDGGASGGDPAGGDDDGAQGSDSGGSEPGDGSLQGGVAGDSEVDEGDGEDSPQPQDQGQGVGSQSSPQQLSALLGSMVRKSSTFDEQENHGGLDGKPDTASLPQAMKAAVAKALTADLSDQELEEELTDGFVDQDMQNSIDQFRDGMADMTSDSLLVSDARARVLFIDVEPDNVDAHSRIVLSTKEQESVDRMRGIFFRTLGRQKAQRNASGTSIDMDAAIQYDIEPSDPEIFESEENNQGFAYLTLCDMSGSMSGSPFQQVCHGTEMLKKSLNFPFVDGTLWGFRGGDPIGGRREVSGEVWLYRYAKHCQGYLGLAKVPGKPFRFPVQCGGLTPMHSALRVAVRHLLTRVSPGMAKRLFLLTDGAPCGVKTSGHGLPHWVLQQFVAKEIQWARQKGIHVYTLVIGSQLGEKECRQMFGPPQYWRNASSTGGGENSIDHVLQHLVIQNFERYLKSRG